ncbi:hypothetical protein NHP190012_11650 [Helicobacter sp. NHP19-012]|uniref:Uncharacterized protein n=1 Tax=Helicobacter gastrofelis TaxID=2849642 RepID=A0ABN6I7R4_9HELI|nr:MULTISPECIES: hypothetical protein [unclassified Helicobacter]BCZ19523.1 hypothetical protein NHP190012_11650 [Helicobacter sp. NHP19-012]GMB96689.1 hypothetical protein NHP22001_12780 [Helicobacter sp. NHP22-001]
MYKTTDRNNGRKINYGKFIIMQTEIANISQMQWGRPTKETGPKHITHKQYRAIAKETR